jgi:hypothetical protein
MIFVHTENLSMTTQPKQTEWKAPAVDIEAIKQTALDYVEGWYEGNTD